MSGTIVQLNCWSYRWYISHWKKQTKNGTACARNRKVTRLSVEEWQCCLTLNKLQLAILDLGQQWVAWELALNPAIKMQNAPVTWRATELWAVARQVLVFETSRNSLIPLYQVSWSSASKHVQGRLCILSTCCVNWLFLKPTSGFRPSD